MAIRSRFPAYASIVLLLPLVSTATAKYSGGTGEPNDPYRIATAADLIALGEDPNDYERHFILTGDIDLAPNLPGRKVISGREKSITDPPAYSATVDMGICDLGSSSLPGRVHVDAVAQGSNDGSSWANAFIHLQDGLAAALAGDEIWVAAGTYKPDQRSRAIPGNQTTSFKLVNDVAIFGGFPTGGGAWEQRDPVLYETILSGDLGVQGDPCDNSHHVVVVCRGAEPNTVLNGFTITGGNAYGPTCDPCLPDCYGFGGGLCSNRGSPTVANCVFTGNGGDMGAGAYCLSGEARFLNCRFIANVSRRDGGGLLSTQSGTIISNCLFADNVAGLNGGGLFLYDRADPYIINCRFWGNSAGGDGGGAMNHGSRPNFVGCVFTGNAASGNGGGLCNLDASEPGYSVGCTFSSNTANTRANTSNGGGIYDVNSPHIIVNCILWGNRAKGGHQLAARAASDVKIDHCCVEGGHAQVVLDNSTFTWGPGNITTDPLFVDADGPDGIAGTEDDRLDLAADSPCLDAGDNRQVLVDASDLDGDDNASERAPLDVAGNARFVNDAATDEGVADPPVYPAIVDMGAYERGN